MTLRERIAQAAFWHGQVCPICGETVEDEETTSCPECGHEPLARALDVQQLLDRLESEED